MAATSANGASGLTASFLPVLKASLQRDEEPNGVSRAVTATVEQQVQSNIASAASESNDVASVALAGRGRKIDISARTLGSGRLTRRPCGAKLAAA